MDQGKPGAVEQDEATLIDLWLDDIRDPALFGCPGYVWVRTVAEAKVLLEKGVVRKASLDHDLGACNDCIQKFLGRIPDTLEEIQYLWLDHTGGQSMPTCDHAGSGYTLICWMEEFGHWPKEMPRVHSANWSGRSKMEAAIRREHERNGRWQ